MKAVCYYLLCTALLFLGLHSGLYAQKVAVSVDLFKVHYTHATDCCNDVGGYGGCDDPTIGVLMEAFANQNQNRQNKVSTNEFSGYDCSLGPRNPRQNRSLSYEFDNPNYKIRLAINQGRERDTGSGDDNVCPAGTGGGALEVLIGDYSECDIHTITISRTCGSATYHATFHYSWYYSSLDAGEIDVPVRRLRDRQALLGHAADTSINLEQPSPMASFQWQYLDNFQWKNISYTTKNAELYTYIIQNTSGIGTHSFRRLASVVNNHCSNQNETIPSNFVQIKVSDTCYNQLYFESFDDGSANMAQNSTGQPFHPWVIVNDTLGTTNKYFNIGYDSMPDSIIISYAELNVTVPDTFYYLDFVHQYELGQFVAFPPMTPSSVKIKINGTTVRSYPSFFGLQNGLEGDIWQPNSISLPIGTHYIRWEYTKTPTTSIHVPEYYRLDDIYVRKKHPDFRPLVELFYRTNGDFFWTNRNGWEDRLFNLNCDVCSWYGVTCDSSSGRVVALDLSNNNLNGTLPPAFDELSELRYLDLSNNPNLEQPLPLELFKLTKLEYLNLSDCSFYSEISANIGNLDSLRYCNISNNNLSGILTPEIGDLARLDTLDLSDNDLVGNIPTSFQFLTTLDYVDVSNNNLSGCYDLQLKSASSRMCIAGSSMSISNGNQFYRPWDHFCNNEYYNIYLDSTATGNNDGLTWTNAYSSVTNDQLPPCLDTIYIAKGTYLPNSYPLDCASCNSERDYTFHFPGAIHILGGFPNGGGSIEDRNPESFKTILDGNIGNATEDDNTYHIATITTSVFFRPTHIDGIIFQNGNASGAGAATLDGCSIRRSESAALAYCYGPLVISNCEFKDNITDGNIHTIGLYSNDSFYCSNSKFINNEGVIQIENTAAKFENCLFQNNISDDGAAVEIIGGGTLIERCHFDGNTSTGNGGALYVDGDVIIDRCIFSNNQASDLGGALFINAGQTRITNSLVHNNQSSEGGAIYNESNDTLLLVNVSIADNDGSGSGDAMRLRGDGTIIISNSILFNPGDEIDGSGGGGPGFNGDLIVNHTLLDDLSYGGVGNIDADPLFIDPSNSDYRVSLTSPVVNAGENLLLDAHYLFDLDHNPRINNDTVDMGAYEYPIDCNHPDIAFLDSIYQKLDGINWTINTGWNTDCDPCNWYGVVCNGINRVAELNLVNNNLSGSLPVELSQLEHLIAVRVNNNSGIIGCYQGDLQPLCDQLGVNGNNTNISNNTNLDATWEDFCACNAGICPCNEINIWQGGNDNWDVAANWSLGHVPRACESVKIQNATDIVTIPVGYYPVIYLLEVSVGAQLLLPVGQKIHVLADPGFNGWDVCD